MSYLKEQNFEVFSLVLFQIYDVDRDGIISKKEFADVVNCLYADYLTTDSIKRMVNMSMLEMDSTQTDQIHFDDFQRAFEPFDVYERLIITFPD